MLIFTRNREVYSYVCIIAITWNSVYYYMHLEPLIYIDVRQIFLVTAHAHATIIIVNDHTSDRVRKI